MTHLSEQLRKENRMNKTSLMREVEGLVERGGFDDDLIDRKEVAALIRQLDEPNTSATHLSEQLKAVQEALGRIANRIGTSRQMYDAGNILEDVVLNALPAEQDARQALSLLPAIIEGVAGMEQLPYAPGESQLIQIIAEASYWEDNPLGNGNGISLHKYRATAVYDAIRPYLRTPQPVRQVSAEVVDAELHALDFEGDETLVTFAVPHGTRWSAGKYLIAAIQHPEGEK